MSISKISLFIRKDHFRIRYTRRLKNIIEISGEVILCVKFMRKNKLMSQVMNTRCFFAEEE